VRRDASVADLVRARFVERENRFVARAELADGRVVRAHLPNTGRLTGILVPAVPVVLRYDANTERRTSWTMVRVWDGVWVALEAADAAALVAGNLEGGGRLADWPAVGSVRREVVIGRHRFDLAIDLADGGAAVAEVKSLTRARGGLAPLSDTPSTRGVGHLEVLGDIAAAGAPAAAVFVVQRPDAEVVDLTAPADPGWVAAVRRGRDRGVAVVAYACEVDERRVRLGHPIPVRDG